MTRKAILRPALIKILERAGKPLRFTELSVSIQKELNRNSLDDKQLVYNLRKLMDQGVLEKTIIDGKLAYRLTYSHYEQALTKALMEILDRRKPSEVYASLTDEKAAPHIVFIAPPAYDYETKKALEQNRQYRDFGTYGGGPMNRVGEIRYIPEWENPTSAISSVMLNDYYGLLDQNERNGISELLRWAYWIGCKCSIEGTGFGPSFSLPRLIKENKAFAIKCIDKFGDNHKRVDLEQTLIKILDLTEELIREDNLSDFLFYLYGELDEYNLLLRKLTLLEEGPVCGGERIFQNFTEFHDKVLLGLFQGGILQDSIPFNIRSYKEQLFLMSSKIWDDFIEKVMIRKDLFTPTELKMDKQLRKIHGSLRDAVVSVTKLKNYIKPLLDLSWKRQIMITYCWGFVQTLSLSKKSFIPEFEGWLESLEKGYLDHETLVFEKGIESVIRTIRAIKRGKKPPSLLIDLRSWTTRDIFEQYPYGKDLQFWEKLLAILQKRRGSLQQN